MREGKGQALSNGDCPVVTRRPYPNFTGVYIDSAFRGVSSYNAMNVKLERRTSSLALQAIYTWSKSLDNKSAAAGIGNAIVGWNGYMDNHNPSLDYGRSDFDVGQRFVTNFVYQLPFGRGQQYLSSINKVADGVIGGWRLGGIVTYQQGFPFSVYGADPFGLLDVVFGTGNRTNQIGSVYPSGFNSTTGQWFNTSAFAQSAPAHYGTSGRNIARGPDISTWDMNIAKEFGLGERMRLEFRAEAFNVWNKPQYGAPSTTINTPTYGQITGLSLSRREIQFGLKLLF